MARAVMTTPEGATVTIEGQGDEVAALLVRLGVRKSGPMPASTPEQVRQPRRKSAPMNLIGELIDEGFFREPRELSAVGLALKERGHIYPVTTLSPLMLRLVRRKELRRVRQEKRWAYVGG